MTKSKRTGAFPTTPPHLFFHWTLLVFIASSCVNGEELFCPSGWLAFGNGDCFLVSEHLSTWLSARSFCIEEGGDLVALSNTSEEALLTDYINATSEGHTEGLWVGLNDINMPGIFEWSDSSPLTFTKWPQDVPQWDAANATGNCVILNHQLLWDIKNCTAEFGFICRMRNASRAAILKQTAQCHPGMYSFRNSCYWTVSGESWTSADQWCQSEGGHLATIEDSSENAFIYTMLVHLEHKVHWIGLNVSQNTQRLTWVTGEDIQYSNWNFPPEITPGLCGVMVRFGKWMLQSCNFEYAAGVCEKSMTPLPTTTPIPITLSLPDQCPEGWTFFNDYCYLVQPKQLFTWEQSRNDCLSLGGDLAHFISKEEEVTAMSRLLTLTDEEKAQALFDTFRTSLSRSVWIGLRITVLPSPGTRPPTTVVALLWTDGTSPTYHNWQTGPNTSISDLCILLPLMSGQPQWNEKSCDTKAGYVCRKAAQSHGTAVRDCSVVPCVPPTSPSDPDSVPSTPTTTPPPTTTSTTPVTTTLTSSGCPTDWDEYGTKCFSFVLEPAEWRTSRAICQNLGPNHDLASIHSPGEQAFFLGLMMKNGLQEAWIGLNDLTAENHFEWSDGTPLDFVHWLREQSLDPSGNPERQEDENCVVIDLSSNSDKWDVKPCRSVIGFFCQLTLENEDGLAEMPGRPPDGEWIPPPLDTNPTTEIPLLNTEENPWPEGSPVQEKSEDGQPNIATTSTYRPLEPETSEILPQDPDIPILSDLPASQRAILEDFAESMPTTTTDPWWMSNDAALTKSGDTTDYRPLTSGTIAGIILGCLLGSGFIASGLIYLYHHHVTSSVIRREKLSFDNALYNPNADQIQLNTNEETSTTPA